MSCFKLQQNHTINEEFEACSDFKNSKYIPSYFLRQLNILIKFQQYQIINERVKSGKLKSRGEEEEEEAMSMLILAIFRTVIKMEPN